jgi:hypothetical protein
MADLIQFVDNDNKFNTKKDSSDPFVRDNRLANARLIAAAPSLLAYLKALTFSIEEGIPLTTEHAAYVAATDCIRKAEGK